MVGPGTIRQPIRGDDTGRSDQKHQDQEDCSVLIHEQKPRVLLSILFPIPNNKVLVFEKSDAQIGIRIRVVGVTGRHDRPLHYLGITKVPPPGFEPGTSR